MRMRLANAEIASGARGRVPRDTVIPFLCECDDDGCSEYVQLVLREYDEIRDDYHYIVSAGHSLDAGVLVKPGAEHDVYAVRYGIGFAAQRGR